MPPIYVSTCFCSFLSLHRSLTTQPILVVSFKWLFPTNTSDWSDVKLIFEALSSVGLCSSAATFIDFVDNVVLPKIDFESLDDERPAIDDGTTSVAKFTPPVMRLGSFLKEKCKDLNPILTR